MTENLKNQYSQKICPVDEQFLLPAELLQNPPYGEFNIGRILFFYHMFLRTLQ